MAIGGQRTLTVVVGGDASGALKAFGQVEKKSGKMSGALKGATKAVGLFGIAAGAAAGVGAFKAINAASDLSEAVNKANVVFGDAAKSVQEFSKTAASGLGLSREAALDGAASMGAMFDAMGLAETKSADMSVQMVQLAADMASFNNEDPSEMLDRLRAGLSGEAEPLKRFGILINESAVKTKALALGLADASGNISEQNKVLARNALIMEQTSKQQGDFARTSDGLANMQRRLTAMISDLAAELGTHLLPIAERVLGFLIEKLDQFSAWVRDNEAAIKAFFEGVGSAMFTLAADFKKGFEVIQPAIERFIRFVVDNKPVMIAALAAIGVAIAFAFGPVGLAFAAVVGIIVLIGKFRIQMLDVAIAVLKAVDGMGQGFKSTFATIAELIGKFMELSLMPLVTAINMISKGLGFLGIGGGQQIKLDLSNTFKNAVEGFFGALPGAIGNLEGMRRGFVLDDLADAAQRANDEATRRQQEAAGSGGVLPGGGGTVSVALPASGGGGGGGVGGGGSVAVVGAADDVATVINGNQVIGLPAGGRSVLQTHAGDVIINFNTPMLGTSEELSQAVLAAIEELQQSGRNSYVIDWP